MSGEGIIRQGDVWLIPLNAEERASLRGQRRARLVRSEKNVGVIVAAGEATGHHHRIKTKRTRLYRNMRVVTPTRNERHTVLSVPKGGATITHEEHAALKIPEGDFKVVIAREYVPQAAPRRVYD